MRFFAATINHPGLLEFLEAEHFDAAFLEPMDMCGYGILFVFYSFQKTKCVNRLCYLTEPQCGTLISQESSTESASNRSLPPCQSARMREILRGLTYHLSPATFQVPLRFLLIVMV